jgi:hypothetical protein
VTIRQQLLDAGISQRSAARAVGVNERTMRKYCSPTNPLPAPKYIKLAIQQIIDEKKGVDGDD